MRLPHIPKIDWEPILKIFERVVVVYKITEGALEMFGFITKFKTEVKDFIANAEARFKSIEAKLENLVHKPEDDVKAEDTPKAD